VYYAAMKSDKKDAKKMQSSESFPKVEIFLNLSHLGFK
jgi:hypothetical protein